MKSYSVPLAKWTSAASDGWEVVTVVKPNVVVTVNHDATTLSAKHFIVPHASMSGEVVLETNEYALA